MKKLTLNQAVYSIDFNTTGNSNHVSIAKALNIQPNDIVAVTYKTATTSEGLSYFVETVTVK
jgi:fructose-1,6-bisphosphatase/sedoheptulose 1,7-bisphosphatase-like protein